ncbi:hypothetical protein Tco_0374158 [Tanacetum coccineum]
MEHARKQQVPKETITSSDTTALKEFDQKTTLFETMTKSKSFNKSLKQKALYHALMKSILEDEDAMDEGAKSTESSKGTSKSHLKSTGKSAQAEETVFEAGDTQGPQNRGEDTGNTDEPPIVNVDPKDWFKKPERPPTPDPEWNKGKSVENKPTQKWLSDLAKSEKPSRTFDDLMRTPIDFSAFVINRLQISKLTQDILTGTTLKERMGGGGWKSWEGSVTGIGEKREASGGVVMDELAEGWSTESYFCALLQGGSTDRTYTTSLTKTKAAKYDLPKIEDMHYVCSKDVSRSRRVEDLQLGGESYQKKLNISRPMMHKAGIIDLKPYSAYSNP